VSKSARRDIAGLLTKIRTRPLECVIARCVPQIDFMERESPLYLFTSHQRNRCNPAGLACIYFSENEETANAEYQEQWLGMKAGYQPKLTFHARIRLARVLDLEMADVREVLGVSDRDLFGSWRREKRETLLQAIGRSINGQTNITAMRFQSRAAKNHGFLGWNFVIFKDTIRLPDQLAILGNTDEPLETWPP
jgi:hypothetical protein